MSDHYMTLGSDGMVSGCGKRSYQLAISTEFTFFPSHVSGKCKACVKAAEKDVETLKHRLTVHPEKSDQYRRAYGRLHPQN